MQVLAVCDLQREVEAELPRAALRGLDERGREVRSGHDGARAGRVEGDVPGPAAEIEPVLACDRRQALDERDVHLADDLRDVLERRRAPDLGVAAGQLLECHAFLQIIGDDRHSMSLRLRLATQRVRSLQPRRPVGAGAQLGWVGDPAAGSLGR